MPSCSLQLCGGSIQHDVYRWLSWQLSGSDVVLSTESSRHPEGEVGRYCPKRQCAYSRGTVCSQKLGAHASIDCDKVPYTFRKGKTPTPKELDLPGLFSVKEDDGVS